MGPCVAECNHSAVGISGCVTPKVSKVNIGVNASMHVPYHIIMILYSTTKAEKGDNIIIIGAL